MTSKITLGASSDVFPDLHHKMSKKIAQLTKVIYHLNTRNEDHQSGYSYYHYLILLLLLLLSLLSLSSLSPSLS